MAADTLQIIPQPIVEPPVPTGRPAVTVEGDTARVVVGEPELILGKFKDVDALVAAYKELESGRGKAVETVEAPVVEPVVTPDAAVESAGFDMDTLSAEYREKGDLSPETRAALAAKGITPAQIDAHIEGQKALASQFTDSVAAGVGGAVEMGQLLKWASTGLTAEEIAAYNAVVETGNPGATSLALQGIRAKYIAENGKAPKLINTETAPTAVGPQPFRSMHEQVAAQKDPRYKAGDKAYHTEVYARIAGAKRAGLY